MEKKNVLLIYQQEPLYKYSLWDFDSVPLGYIINLLSQISFLIEDGDNDKMDQYTLEQGDMHNYEFYIQNLPYTFSVL